MTHEQVNEFILAVETQLKNYIEATGEYEDFRELEDMVDELKENLHKILSYIGVHHIQ